MTPSILFVTRRLAAARTLLIICSGVPFATVSVTIRYPNVLALALNSFSSVAKNRADEESGMSSPMRPVLRSPRCVMKVPSPLRVSISPYRRRRDKACRTVFRATPKRRHNSGSPGSRFVSANTRLEMSVLSASYISMYFIGAKYSTSRREKSLLVYTSVASLKSFVLSFCA